MDVSDEGVTMRVSGITTSLVNLNASISSAEVLMFDDAGQQLIRIRIFRCTTLAHVDAAGGHVEEVVDHAGAHEEVARSVVVAAPGIAGAVGEDFELPLGFFVTAHRPCAANAGIKFESLALGLTGAADFAVGEDAVGHIKPAIRAPSEAVHEFVGVFAAESGQTDSPGIRFVVAIVIAEVEQVRLLTDVDAIVTAKNGGGEIETFDEDGALVSFAVVIGVFENDDAVARDLVAVFGQRMVLIILGFTAKRRRQFRTFGVFISLYDPQAPTMIPSHGDGILHHGLMRKAADLVALRHTHFCAGFFRRGADRRGWRPLAFDLFSCGMERG